MKLLVTGGCGFLGSNLAAHGIQQGMDVCVFDNLSRLGSVSNLAWLRRQGTVKHVHGDIRNTNDVDRCLASFKPEAVFHLAGQVAMTTSVDNPRMDFEVNVCGTLNVLESVRAHTPQAQVFYSSTNKVYGDLEQFRYEEAPTRWVCIDRPNGFGEDVTLDFHSPYGCSKGSADQYLLDYARMFDLRTTVFRHSSMYGGRQFATVDQGWVGWFCEMARQQAAGVQDSFTISGSGKQVRDVLHADDMVRLYFGSIGNALAAGQAFNIGGGQANSLSLLELFTSLGNLTGSPLRFERMAPRRSDQRVFVADVAKAKSLLGWEPQVTAQDGVARMMRWVTEAAARSDD